MDFITGLPKSGNRPSAANPAASDDTILVVVDRLIQMAYYIPTHEGVTSEEVPRLYLDYVFRIYGLPDSIVSDRGTQFTSGFSRALGKLMGISQNLSTSFHP